MRIPEKLKNLISQRKCVAFVGAGFSMPCGMPSWLGLMEKILEEAKLVATDSYHDELIADMKESLEYGDIMLSVSIAKKLFKTPELNTIIRKTFSRDIYNNAGKEEQKIIDKRLDGLLNTPWAGIVTTNYDDLIEMGVGQHTDMPTIFSEVDSAQFGTSLVNSNFANRFYIKLHGSISNGNYVLGTEEYDRHYLSERKVSIFLCSIMLNYHLIFIGCSLEDEIVRLRRKLLLDFNGNIPTCYAVLPQSKRNMARKDDLLNTAQIQIIPYPDGEHKNIEKFLDELKKSAEESTGSFITGDANIVEGNLRKVSKNKKLNSIGHVNVELYKLISDGDEKDGLTQIELLSKIAKLSKNKTTALSGISEAEIIYRALFLSNIGLLNCTKNSKEEVFYSAIR
jgi:hypothetical protein